MKTLEAAHGKWRGILAQLGIGDEFLRGPRVHGPCPLCGGEDRYRFDDKEGMGTYICNQCGAGTGMQLLQRYHGWDFATAAREVDKIVGNVQRDKVKPAMAPDKQRKMLNQLWLSGRPIKPDCVVGEYLAKRDVSLPRSDCLRYVERCPVPGGGFLPAMVAMVTTPCGKPATLHRTYLGPDGKANIETPRALMPGGLEAGSAVRLAPAGKMLGIAEGIETALAVTKRFGLPCWAAINAGNLAKWKPPAGVTTIIIFGDNDPKFGGAAAAYTCAHHNAVSGLYVEVNIPQQLGLDWADKEAVC